MRLTRLAAAVVTASALFTAPALAANQTFTDAAAFNLAAGATQTESFESLTASVRSNNTIVTSLLTVTPEAALIGIQSSSTTPEDGFGSFATEGTQYLFSYNPGVAPGTLKFTFNAPVRAFGLTITDIGEATGVVALRTNVGAFTADQDLATFPPTFGNGSQFFFGLTQDVAFTEAYVTVTGADEALGVDAVRIAAVPEPGEYALMLAGLALVGTVVRRRRKRC